MSKTYVCSRGDKFMIFTTWAWGFNPFEKNINFDDCFFHVYDDPSLFSHASNAVKSNWGEIYLILSYDKLLASRFSFCFNIRFKINEITSLFLQIFWVLHKLCSVVVEKCFFLLSKPLSFVLVYPPWLHDFVCIEYVLCSKEQKWKRQQKHGLRYRNLRD